MEPSELTTKLEETEKLLRVGKRVTKSLEGKRVTKSLEAQLEKKRAEYEEVLEKLHYEESRKRQKPYKESFEHVHDVEVALQVSTLADGTLIYGREEDKKIIIELMLSNDDKHSRVIYIVGESGSGKSTMVNLVYNDQTVGNAFDSKVFLCISEKDDERKLLKVVLQTLTGASRDIPDVTILEGIVREELMGKKILLVLDNANHQNQSFWDCVSKLLGVASKGSVALVTNLVQINVDGMEGMEVYPLSNLSHVNSWAIFKHYSLCGHDPNLDPELTKIGELLLSKCNHNPLCIRVLGALLNYSVNKQWWLAILESQAWESHDQFGVDTPPALRVCYEFMPAHLAKCFSYCSLFPKDYIFVKHYVIHLWMAQGLLVSRGLQEGRELEDIGVQCFDELIQRSFFHHSPFVYAKEDQFVVHELLHCLAEYVSREGCFRSEDGLCNIPETISHFSLVSSEPQTINLKPITEKAKDLQTCLVVNRSTLEPAGFLFPIPSLKELNDLFLKFKNLRVLDLSHTCMTELPDSIRTLGYLRFISLNNTKIKHLPRELCTIVNLETMEARDCRYLVELPKEMYKLKKLRHLDIRKQSGYILMPVKIGELTDLQTLPTFNIGCNPSYATIGELNKLNHLNLEIKGLNNVRDHNEAMEANLERKSKLEIGELTDPQTLATFNIGNNPSYATIGELNKLNHLMGHLEINGLNNVRDHNEAMEANLERKSKLESLSLDWSGSGQYNGNENEDTIAELVLQSLEPTKNLKELIIRSYVGSRFPHWIEDSSFENMDSIILDGCFNCKTFPDLSQLPSLRCLSVRKMSGVQKLGEFGEKRIPRFQSLELLNLWEMYDLEELFEIEQGDAPKLRTISIYRCSALRKITRFPSLVELSFSSCARVPDIEELPSLVLLKFENFLNTKHFYLPPELPNLKQLELSYCSELLSLEGLSAITSMEKIVVIRCPKFDLLGNSEQCNFKRVNITRYREELCRIHDSHGTPASPKAIGTGALRSDSSTSYEQSPISSQGISYIVSATMGEITEPVVEYSHAGIQTENLQKLTRTEHEEKVQKACKEYFHAIVQLENFLSMEEISILGDQDRKDYQNLQDYKATRKRDNAPEEGNNTGLELIKDQLLLTKHISRLETERKNALQERDLALKQVQELRQMRFDKQSFFC